MQKEKIKHYQIPIRDLDISMSDVEEIAHMGDDMPSYQAFLDEELKQLEGVASVQGGYSIEDACVKGDYLLVGEVEFVTGKAVSHHYRNMNQAVVFICTAGEEISNRSKALTEQGELVEGYLLDVLGSVMVEKAMDIIQDALQNDMAEQGLKITNRYSPGYCDWNVNEQKELFSFFPEQFCKVSLSESCLMNPVKTVSGIIGIGENVKFHKHVCHACSSVNCLYRNENNK